MSVRNKLAAGRNGNIPLTVGEICKIAICLTYMYITKASRSIILGYVELDDEELSMME